MASYRHTYDRPIPKLNSKLRPSEGRPSKTRPSHHSAPTDCVSPFKNLTISIAVNTTFFPFFIHPISYFLPTSFLSLSVLWFIARQSFRQTAQSHSLVLRLDLRSPLPVTSVSCPSLAQSHVVKPAPATISANSRSRTLQSLFQWIQSTTG